MVHETPVTFPTAWAVATVGSNALRPEAANARENSRTHPIFRIPSRSHGCFLGCSRRDERCNLCPRCGEVDSPLFSRPAIPVQLVHLARSDRGAGQLETRNTVLSIARSLRSRLARVCEHAMWLVASNSSSRTIDGHWLACCLLCIRSRRTDSSVGFIASSRQCVQYFVSPLMLSGSRREAYA